MKKKLFSFIITFTFVLIGAMLLIACMSKKKYYFTMQTEPSHCSVQYSHNEDKNGNKYIVAEEEYNISIYPDEGYFSNDFKLFINSQEVELEKSTEEAEDIVRYYSYRFIPTEEFNVTFSGTFERVKRFLTIKKEDGNSENWWEEPFDKNRAENKEVFIRFGENNILGLPTTEMVYADFVTFNTVKKLINYGDTLDFYVYTKGFKGAPNILYLTSTDIFTHLNEEFYHVGDKIGCHYTFTQKYFDSTLTFKNASFYINTSIQTGENSGSGNIKIGSNKLIIDLAEDFSTLTITINGYNNLSPDIKATFSNLKLKINNMLQNVDFTQDDDGVFTISLKKPYEYYSNQEDYFYYFQYNVDLNFYTLEYFKGEQLTPIFEE